MSGAAVISCHVRSPIYRASAKLLVTTTGAAAPADETVRESDDRFFETQQGIIRSVTILQRAEHHLNRTPADIERDLVDLHVIRVGNSDILQVSVDSPSQDFAVEFASALVDEYLKFREEQRTQTTEAALLQVTHEAKRLSDELNILNEKVLAFAKEHDVSAEAAWDQMPAVREERHELQSLHEALVGQITKMDATRSFPAHNISVLEPVTLEPGPVR